MLGRPNVQRGSLGVSRFLDVGTESYGDRYVNMVSMKTELNGVQDEIVGWPDAHFAHHRKKIAGMDPQATRAVLALRIVAQRVENALGGWFAHAELTPQKFGVLLILSAEEGPISLSDVRRYLVTTQANVTGLVAGLERDGLIERTASTEDRRVSYIELSRAGKRVVQALGPDYFGRSKTALRGLTQAEKKTFVELLSKVAAGFS